MSLDGWTKLRTTSANATTWSTTSPPSLGANVYAELIDSGTESYSEEASYAERVLLVDWDHREALYDALLGYAYYSGDAPDYELHRILPAQHPTIPTLYASSVDANPWGVVTGDADVDYVSAPFSKLKVRYTPLDYAVLPDNEITLETERFISRKYTYTPEYLTLTGGLQFHGAGAPTYGRILNAQPVKRVYTTNLIMTWHWVPALPDDPFQVPNGTTIAEYQGCINSTTFEGFSAGTVLFVGCEPQMVKPRLAADSFFWRLQFVFNIKDNGTGGVGGEEKGHDYFYDVQASPPKWDRVVSVNGKNATYQRLDLNDLFVITGV